jgi:hypothetical protein
VVIDSDRVPWWGGKRIRLVVLLMCLCALLFYLLAARTGVLSHEAKAGKSRTGGAWASGCPARDAPPVARVAPEYLAGLRVDLGNVMRGKQGRLYETGTVSSENAWSDNPPQPSAVQPPTVTRVSGAYEMRWWTPNRDDIVADAFVFAQTDQARDFFQRASSARCRPGGAQIPVLSPPNTRDVIWRNPDGVVQEDVYLLRGNRVYRIGDVSPQRTGIAPRKTEQRLAFFIVDSLVRALPEMVTRARGRRAAAR